jgi:hypothetical protein
MSIIPSMATENLLYLIDVEIVRLMEARKILEAVATAPTKKPGPRPSSHHKKPGSPTTGPRRWGGKPEAAEIRKHIITPAGRARIGRATRQRWAALRSIRPEASRLAKLPL